MLQEPTHCDCSKGKRKVKQKDEQGDGRVSCRASRLLLHITVKGNMWVYRRYMFPEQGKAQIIYSTKQLNISSFLDEESMYEHGGCLPGPA